MARRDSDDDPAPARPRSDAYTGMLAISLGAMIIACLLLLYDYLQFPQTKPEEPKGPVAAKAPAAPAVGQPPAAPAGGQPPAAPAGGQPPAPPAAPPAQAPPKQAPPPAAPMPPAQPAKAPEGK